ncbi:MULTISPECIES: mechanosensitive ion channel domain-containing protein [unclassified Methanoculleus]|uniref:mechanosensitive ion channel family protein n=1 Tax=unclassified Methanoculleus TaxID=2619537 RepID=UPI0025E3AC7E|nr:MULTISPECIES: mechanosensitive ion channel domain-containing protein [unclassified Methanoculleus]MCK9317593.1 mechanosensitive ion channel family protein [Methanoculleus sp.]MDD2254118.1 mechanosensitive ion channel [Methanoculleus sp.]MDD2786935.1 mechanosensitive ion channel [Methanoculleus sp.]MDD3215869.1 mechanosensitive ion channel [Methanoculleus sp.]MDD4314222.1 mechanosensitive ion channel [Methanoculleus sp.]
MESGDPVLIGGVPLDALFAFVLTLIGLLFLGNLAYMLLRRALDGRVSPGAAKWAAAILQYAVIIGGGYASARYLLAFDLRAVVASLGILGIVVAVSSSQIIQNVLAGVLITINRPVQLEEWIVVGEMPSTGLCKVHDISFTTTILQGLDGGLVLMPNSSIIASKVINYSRGGLMEIRVSISVPVAVDLAQVKEIALAVARNDPRIIQDPGAGEQSAIQDLFDLPYNRRLRSDRPDLAHLEPAIRTASVTDGWIKLTVGAWTRKIPQKDDIVSRYLKEVLRRLSAEEIPVKAEAS